MENRLSFKEQFENWADVTYTSREESRRDRDYRDGKQWTEEEAAALQERGQAPIVINRIGPKVDYLIGVERTNRQDPKAWPRNPGDDGAGEAVTDALRYVADNSDFDQCASECFEDLIVEGIEGSIVEWIDEEISVTRIPFDRLYYDQHSIRRDFSDATFKGLFIWIDKTEAINMFGKDKADEINACFSDSGDAGLEDKPLWIDKKRNRIKVCQHYYKKDGVWHVVYFSGDTVLIEPKESPYTDEDGKPVCPIVLRYAYQDREGYKYGWVRQFIDIQDEVNHRRSKALYILSRRQVIADRGAVDDVNHAKYELTKGDGYIEVTPNMRFDVDPGQDLAAGQAQLMQEAKAEIDAIAARSVISPDSSGRSRMLADSKDLIEVGPLFDTHRSFKRDIYRHIWQRVKQFWDSERWIRVTDNEQNLKYVGLNQPVTIGQELQELAKQGNAEAQEALQTMIATQDPRLNQVSQVKNEVAKLDVDVTISEVMESANIQQEQFEMLVNLAQTYGPQYVPFKMVIEMSQLRNKRDFVDMLDGDPEQQAMNQQMQVQQMQMQMAEMQAKIDKMNAETDNKRADTELKRSETAKTEQQTIQTAVETQIIGTRPVGDVSVNT